MICCSDTNPLRAWRKTTVICWSSRGIHQTKGTLSRYFVTKSGKTHNYNMRLGLKKMSCWSNVIFFQTKIKQAQCLSGYSIYLHCYINSNTSRICMVTLTWCAWAASLLIFYTKVSLTSNNFWFRYLQNSCTRNNDLFNQSHRSCERQLSIEDSSFFDMDAFSSIEEVSPLFQQEQEGVDLTASLPKVDSFIIPKHEDSFYLKFMNLEDLKTPTENENPVRLKRWLKRQDRELCDLVLTFNSGVENHLFNCLEKCEKSRSFWNSIRSHMQTDRKPQYLQERYRKLCSNQKLNQKELSLLSDKYDKTSVDKFRILFPGKSAETLKTLINQFKARDSERINTWQGNPTKNIVKVDPFDKCWITSDVPESDQNWPSINSKLEYLFRFLSIFHLSHETNLPISILSILKY